MREETGIETETDTGEGKRETEGCRREQELVVRNAHSLTTIVFVQTDFVFIIVSKWD